MENNKIIVIKIGGSVLSPNRQMPININFLKEFKEKIVIPLTNKNYKFAITIGGGFLAREFAQYYKECEFSEKYQHKAGVVSSLMNATSFQAMFDDIALDHIVSMDDYSDAYSYMNKGVFSRKFKILISAGGTRYESSTDMDAVLVAMRLDVSEVISIKHIGCIYDLNPSENPNAKVLSHITWEEYLKLIGNKKTHKPGQSWPIDPVAVKNAQENKISFKIVDENMNDILNAIMNDTFNGTLVN